MTGQPTARRTGLAARLMTAQVLVIGVGALTLVVAAALVAPSLFNEHLARTGEDSPLVRHHAAQAFASSFAISLALALAAALTAAGIVSWFLVRRVAYPVAALADAADALAAGSYQVRAPAGGFGSELARLSAAFDHMAVQLADTDAARTRMLADLAHEVRTPLATLEAYIDGLEDGVVPAGAEAYQTMRDQVARLRRLAGDLREAAAAEEHALGLDLQTCEPAALVEAAVAAAGPRYQANGVQLAVAAPKAPAVLADRVRIQQVLANLLDNSLRHTPAGGHTTVSVAQGAGDVRISVTDDGAGIPADQLDAVFDRFYRVDPARAVTDSGGSGLGLTIARAIVTAHGGTLTATSPGPGRGATFTVTLPLASDRPGRSAHE
jgi:two-component system, OmpR family, sensor histidine kinase BaeS